MDFPAGLLPTWLLLSSDLLFVALLLLALLRAPWQRLTENAFSNLLFASCVGLLLLWNLRAGVQPGVNFHLLGVTSLTLMVGWAAAFLGVALVTLGTTLNGHGALETYALNSLIMGGLPVLVTWQLLGLARRRLPYNFFVYVYVNAFLAAGLGIVTVGFATAAVLWLAGVHSFAWLGQQYLAYFPLMFFSEAVMNGMLMTMMVALRPAWVCSFDDELYLDGK
ncbi:energy-coupling factor ABC transporter permease [Thiohalobacter sp. IOR34]|uniref:energy-coupling factor ABC transporter permease n=1 Tax=Thiohalobacter sp. IOR34 TaxID=3057176 RepID=UPI0025B249EB|nr:energy-coupling factor ABC transporter permease [Thiohalobacter sp. IOR34]WJW76640.1 energy-coupling factor ABC transporter permease [Thiohalobacter sp. IOR34]